MDLKLTLVFLSATTCGRLFAYPFRKQVYEEDQL